jgi:ribosomal protein L11 methyltransferase
VDRPGSIRHINEVKALTSDSTTSVARLETDEQSAQRIADLVAESYGGDGVAVSLADAGGGRWRVAIHFSATPDAGAVRALAAAAIGPAAAEALRFERVATKDWVSESLAGLKPVTAGRFIIHGAHDRTRIPVNRIGIEIEAALAFGTGHHGTTRGCLLALDRICKSFRKRHAHVRRHPEVRAKGAPRRISARAVALRGSLRSHLRVTGPYKARRILDLGTGSGVLAIAAARALRQHVLATDIDASAVRVARVNARLNRAGALVDVVTANGVTTQHLRARAPFDLIFANILLRPLKRMATPLARLAAPDGCVVLSGLLPEHANAVIAAYHALTLERRIACDGWTTLVFRRRARAQPAVARRRRDP